LTVKQPHKLFSLFRSGGHRRETADSEPVPSLLEGVNQMPITAASIQVRLGEESVLRLAASDVYCRAYVKHDGVYYAQPLVDWGTRQELRFRPEAPGRYTVAVEIEDADRIRHWNYLPIDVVPAIAASGPKLIEIDADTRLWTPSEWESQIMGGHEPQSIAYLKALVKPGQVIFDVGANLGIYSIPLARIGGPQSRVYCVEANPVCVYFLQMNLRINNITTAEVLPFALHEDEGTVDFTVNYRNLMLGLAGDLPYAHKPGHKIGVAAMSLDAAIDRYQLPRPDFIKIDIEGAEAHAVRGMSATLDACSPTVLIELHGQGAARETLQSASWTGYRFQETQSGTTFQNARELSEWFPDACLQVIARRRPD
jgi:FkbM family methyltransferase